MSRQDADVVNAFSESQEIPQTVELEDLSAGTATFPDQTTAGPPIDGGYLAWRLLLSAFVFESLLWGFPVGTSINLKCIPSREGSLLTYHPAFFRCFSRVLHFGT